MTAKHYDMTTAWWVHIASLVFIGIGWVVALIYVLAGGTGPDWWFFAVGLTVVAGLLIVLVRSMAQRVEIAGDGMTVTTALGVRQVRVSDVDRPSRWEGSAVQGSWIRTVRYSGGMFLVPGYSSGTDLLRHLRSAAAAE